MRTLTLSLLSIAFFTHSSFGQTWRIAPTIGMNASAITYSSAFRNNLNTGGLSTKTGPLIRGQLGALLDYEVSDRFSIRSGLLYTGKGGSLNVTASQYGIVQSGRGRYQFDYLEIPLLLNIAVSNNDFRIVGGPVLGLTLNGKGIADGSYYNGYGYFTGNVTRFRIGTGIADEILPIDLSVSLGLVKQLSVGDRPLEIGLHVQPSISKWNTFSQTRSDYYGRNLLIGLRTAYFFDLRR